VPPGEADAVLGLEKLEALRFAHYLAPDGILVVNDHEIPPASLGALVEKYPHHALDSLREKGLHMLVLPATQMAEELGNVRVANLILLGALSQHLDIPQDVWEQTLRERIPERYLAINQEAFAAGAELGVRVTG
jgi:indolepyruvate ferredoxin oxidoreductase beta subunit